MPARGSMKSLKALSDYGRAEALKKSGGVHAINSRTGKKISVHFANIRREQDGWRTQRKMAEPRENGQEKIAPTTGLSQSTLNE